MIDEDLQDLYQNAELSDLHQLEHPEEEVHVAGGIARKIMELIERTSQAEARVKELEAAIERLTKGIQMTVTEKCIFCHEPITGENVMGCNSPYNPLPPMTCGGKPHALESKTFTAQIAARAAELKAGGKA